MESLNSPLVFSHNDVLSGNVLYDKSVPRVLFIDFEYGSYNPRGFDIGNHFNEWAGFDCDWAKNCPSEDQAKNFIRAYLKQEFSRDPNDDEIAVVYKESEYFMAYSHIFWMLWALVQSKYSTVDFDYLDYAVQRKAGYDFQRKKWNI
eukprot:GFYU01014776.1.p1 GENE.GFYU01014776.1~~GFYU01014776.1.p1  ORF type:complete len:163 (+),score=46.74 GFYU01014776.1:49-489(+)